MHFLIETGTISVPPSFGDKAVMSQPEPPSFHLRLPPALREQLQAVKGRNSLNREITERLERSLEPDPALRLAEMLRPLLADMDETDQKEMVSLLTKAIAIWGRAAGKRRRR
ncbi:MAG: Arc family DNA-binding protein [Mesorhizobium sp.]|uniref:Arc family DNA-binding protein n=1 Tax=Mesorhizobium sp. M7A.F.Ca.ET.027.02.1.1 TaxID=2496655 RepID=UPI000FD23BE1|nr:Arc family DNA-binding protein [Mesorhizobium sp. M7A.F.Ca.ET.027.02.1.1]RVD13951.1 Arc family DNA-binding protein [Mesorhizobium sp. M7A.F.Ca.ET.027.02.1.1]RWC94573.1 MAG: Arc family DNA-binding protein [Mesorhizobium sp.]